MAKLEEDRAIRQFALDLGLDCRGAVLDRIVGFCREKIQHWLKEEGAVNSFSELQELICKKLQLVFEEVSTDEDLERIKEHYLAQGETLFAAIHTWFDEKTFATLIQRSSASLSSATDRFIAVIDCRGDKASRAYFSRWHEIAHLITKTQEAMPTVHRSNPFADPIERLMDLIAGEIGFYHSLFQPKLQAAIAEEGRLTFDAVNSVRLVVCPDASFQSTLIASVKQATVPALYLEAGMGLKKAEKEKLESKQTSWLPVEPPRAKLRALVVSGNEAAKHSGLRLNQNMEVPAESVISSFFWESDGTSYACSREDLSLWRHSDGNTVCDMTVCVEAKRYGEKVFALLTPVQ